MEPTINSMVKGKLSVVGLGESCFAAIFVVVISTTKQKLFSHMQALYT